MEQLSLADHVFVHVIRGDVFRLMDASGRPLGEQVVRDLYMDAGLDERACPFQDKRLESGLPINAAALLQVRQFWKPLLARLTCFGALWHDEGPWSGHATWRLNACAQLLPSFLHLRAHNRIHIIPDEISASFKTSLGFSTVLPSILMAFPGLSDAPMTNLYPPKTFFDMLDAEEWLIGNHQVCAGSSSAIMAYYEHLTGFSSSLDTAHDLGIETKDYEPFMDFVSAFLKLWALVGVLTCAAQERVVHGGDYSEALGFAQGAYDRMHEWPIPVRWLLGSSARVIEIVNAFTSLTTDHYKVLFPEHEVPECVEQLVAFCALESTSIVQMTECALELMQAPVCRMMLALGFDTPKDHVLSLRAFELLERREKEDDMC